MMSCEYCDRTHLPLDELPPQFFTGFPKEISGLLTPEELTRIVHKFCHLMFEARLRNRALRSDLPEEVVYRYLLKVFLGDVTPSHKGWITKIRMWSRAGTN